jgi:hypothetical protein
MQQFNGANQIKPEIFSMQLLRNVASDSLEFGYKLSILQVMRKNRRASNKS